MNEPSTFFAAYAIMHANMPPKTPIVPYCNCTRCKTARARRKVRKYLRATGRPLLVYPHEAEEAMRKLQDYHDRGMTRHDVETASNGRLNASSVADWVNGGYKTMYRETYDAIMAMPYLRVSPLGARIPMHGSMRRIGALRRAGWPTKTLAPLLDMEGQSSSLGVLSGGYRKFVFHEHAMKIKQAYEKYIDVDPVDWGVSLHSAARAKSYGAAAGCAPANCWDDDTIDDPEAYPEWTGACGTDYGYSLHTRHAIRARPSGFACDLCAKAHHISRRWPHLGHLMGVSQERVYKK